MKTPAFPPARPTEPPTEALPADAAALPEILDLLPGSMRELADEVGLPLALRLLAACGGTSIYVPRPANAGPDHPLAARLGAGNLAALAAARGGETLDLPRGAALRRALVRRRIAEEAAAGATAAQLTERWGYSRSSIHRILRAPSPGAPARSGRALPPPARNRKTRSGRR